MKIYLRVTIVTSSSMKMEYGLVERKRKLLYSEIERISTGEEKTNAFGKNLNYLRLHILIFPTG